MPRALPCLKRIQILLRRHIGLWSYSPKQLRMDLESRTPVKVLVRSVAVARPLADEGYRSATHDARAICPNLDAVLKKNEPAGM